MMTSHPSPQVAIIIVAWQGEYFLPRCLDSLALDDDAVVVVVDNASTDRTSEIAASYGPRVHRVRSETNLGFCGGNNLGWDFVRQHFPSVRYVALLNQDTRVETHWLAPLVSYLESHPHVGAVQPKLMLDPAVNHFNSTGNRSHFLGFGFTSNYGVLDEGQFDQPREIDFASGAALVVPRKRDRQL